MTCMIVPAWSERGKAPRIARLSYRISHKAEIGRGGDKHGNAKITLRQHKQRGTTPLGVK